MPYTAPAAPQAGLRLRSQRVRGNRPRRLNVVWLVLLVLALLAVAVAIIGASSGVTWTLHGPGFNVIVPGVPIP